MFSKIEDFSATKKKQFPVKLHQMLESCENRSFSAIVSWLPRQDSFRVHRPDEFQNQILPQFFDQTKYKSFQKQLNVWGFNRITKGLERGGYRHSLFIKGRKSLCSQMKRRKGPKLISRPSAQATLATKPVLHCTMLKMPRLPQLAVLSHALPTAPNLLVMNHVNYKSTSTAEQCIRYAKERSKDKVFQQVVPSTKTVRTESPRALLRPRLVSEPIEDTTGLDSTLSKALTESLGIVSDRIEESDELDTIIHDFFKDDMDTFLEHRDKASKIQSFEENIFSPSNILESSGRLNE
jgi:hypothetical protein